MTRNKTAKTDEGTAGLTASERHRLLAAERRRLAIELLADETPPVDLEELAAEIAVRENGSGTADAKTVEHVAITLHHSHLPILAEVGIVDYDPEAHQIDPAGILADADGLL